MDEEYREAVLDAVELVPPGRVTTYGDIAIYVGHALGRGGPRIVGAIMAREGGAVPWWRVVNAAGRVTPSPPDEALRRLRAEGCPMAAGGLRVDLGQARFDFPAPGPSRDQADGSGLD